LVEELSGLPLVSGVHVMAPGNDSGMAEVVAEAARVALRNARKPPARQSNDDGSDAWLLHLQ
jgi:hypothetical protein